MVPHYYLTMLFFTLLVEFFSFLLTILSPYFMNCLFKSFASFFMFFIEVQLIYSIELVP